MKLYYIIDFIDSLLHPSDAQLQIHHFEVKLVEWCTL